MKYENNLRDGPFVALLAAAAAIEQRRPEALVAAFHSISAQAMLGVAARHRCIGYLRRGIVELGVRDERASVFTKAVREYAGKAAIQAYAVRDQLRQLVDTLNEAKIRFALLKGSARLFRGDKNADNDTMCDVDILTPREEAVLAVEALESGGGYLSCASTHRSRHYLARHHHAVPLRPAKAGLPVEVHVQLALLGNLSLATDWRACQMYFERVATAEAEAARESDGVPGARSGAGGTVRGGRSAAGWSAAAADRAVAGAVADDCDTALSGRHGTGRDRRDAGHPAGDSQKQPASLAGAAAR